MLKLSIVIPVYNVEQYIAKCLDSCLQQDLPSDEYEIIVVNDGTPDNSVAIVEGYLQKAPNIRLINRENGGLSAARNTGLKEAKGEYVWFVDSDDFIEPHAIKPLLEKCIEDNLDIVCFNLQRHFEDGRLWKYENDSKCGSAILTGEEFVSTQHMPPAAWAALYKRIFLSENCLTFRVGILHEDQEFTPRAYFLAKRITYVDTVVYNYFQREGSIMKSNQNDRRVKSFIEICDVLDDFITKYVQQNSPALAYFQNQIFFNFTQALAYINIENTSLLEQLKKKKILSNKVY